MVARYLGTGEGASCTLAFRTLVLAAVCGLAACTAESSTSTRDRPAASAEAGRRLRVLVVHSYHSTYEWTASLQRGIERVFGAAHDVEYEVFYMDTKRRSDEASKTAKGELALAITEEWKPHVVISADDDAQAYYARHFIGRDDVKVVFCGVNEAAEEHGYPAANVTGLLQRPPIDTSVELLDQVVQGARRLAFLTDTSPTGHGARAWFEQQASASRVRVWAQPETFREWKRTVRRLNRMVDAVGLYSYHTLRDDDGGTVPPGDVISWTMDNLRVPTFSQRTFAIDDGVLVGYVESGYEAGVKVAEWAVAIARGAPVEDFPVTTEVKGQSMINLTTAEKLGIELTQATIQAFDAKVRMETGDI